VKAYWGSGGIAPHILGFGTRLRWVVSFTPRPLYFQEKSHWYPLDRRLGVDAVVKRKILSPNRDSNTRSSSP
jgi:hypothetical protein